jgi:hypothetical protein
LFKSAFLLGIAKTLGRINSSAAFTRLLRLSNSTYYIKNSQKIKPNDGLVSLLFKGSEVKGDKESGFLFLGVCNLSNFTEERFNNWLFCGVFTGDETPLKKNN